ncbi:Predicted PurR-regulated permease PerM [Lentibacillus halodurans]|uniref:Predicted PurR-regulated permease PerM n=1 Tax=Lentibacillus halodurans TaxID=237679 RepID=A0A1I0V1Q1_9BACI|nr:AI-2E family transporter [Lentibacillus halodurans]SFA69486.1 Predicted PurR-regulated permease PerM [Lentibacillus halodurans]
MFQDNKPLNFLFWIITGIFVFLFIYLLVKLFPVYGAVMSFLWHLLLPFLIAALIAYLLYPVIEKMHRNNIPKSLAVLFIYLLFFGGIGYLGYRVYPIVIHQLSDLQDQLPHLIEMYRDFIYSLYEYTSFLPETVHDKMDELISDAETYMEDLLAGLVRGFTKIFDMIVVITVIPVLVFYFLKDFDSIKQYIKKWIPEKYHHQTGALCRAIDEGLGNYIRGQFIVCLFVGLAAFAMFHFLEIPYALLLAIIIGLTNIIPYFGPIIGAAPAVAITATVSGKLVLMVLLSIFIIQVIEGNFLSPYIVGKSIKIHPVAIIFALLLGGKITGVVGMILAVPVLVIIKVVMSHIISIRNYN